MTVSSFEKENLDSLKAWFDGFVDLPDNERSGFAFIQIMLGIVHSEHRKLDNYSSWSEISVGQGRDSLGYSEAIEIREMLKLIRENEAASVAVDFMSDSGNRFSITITHEDGKTTVLGQIHKRRS